MRPLSSAIALTLGALAIESQYEYWAQLRLRNTDGDHPSVEGYRRLGETVELP